MHILNNFLQTIKNYPNAVLTDRKGNLLLIDNHDIDAMREAFLSGARLYPDRNDMETEFHFNTVNGKIIYKGEIYVA